MKRSVFNLFRPRVSIESLLASAESAAVNGDSEKALDLYAEVMRQKPELALAHYKHGNLLRDRDQLDLALVDYDRAVALNPNYANAFCNRGVVLERLDRLDAAEESYNRAIELNPRDALAYYNRGSVLRELKRWDEALASYDQAIAINPVYADAYCNRGILLADRKRWNDALASYNEAIGISSSFFAAYFNRGVLFHKQKRWDEALSSYDRAIELRPDYAEALCNRGALFADLRRFDWALPNLDRAIAINPDFADAYRNRAALNILLQKYDLALADCNKALELGPGLAEAYYQRAHVLMTMKNFEGAIADFRTAADLKPEFAFLLGTRRNAQMTICDWDGLDQDVAAMVAAIQEDKPVALPVGAFALLESMELQSRAARIWAGEESPAIDFLPPLPAVAAGEKIRIGYFSADFHAHPVAALMAEVFEQHDQSKFDLTAFSFGPPSSDPVRLRLEKAFPRFIDARLKADHEVALLARELQLDIAIDLGGFTSDARTAVFALRAAPIQVNYLGYPGTMSSTYMDYLIADEMVIPETHQQYYGEKIVYLPHCYLPNDSTRQIAKTMYAREPLGLPREGFVFCCFNNSFKLTPAVFDCWMRILHRVEHSVLWLSRGNPSAAVNLHKEATRRGIDTARIIFAERVASPQEHLARLKVADLFLDTHPYNAHATAMDALWAGLPLLTYVGHSFAGRVGASLLHTVGIPELIAHSPEQYEEIAVQLAGDAPRLAAIRQKLAQRRDLTPSLHGKFFARHLEAAYSALYASYESGASPTSQRIARISD